MGRYKAEKLQSNCQICNKTAVGFHYGAYVCEACKKFFVRHASGVCKAYGTCQDKGQCNLEIEGRGKCQHCRYKRCLDLGMNIRHKTSEYDLTSIPCQVCGSKSSGLHFGCITCEGCKGFYRRMIKFKGILVCFDKNECDLNFKSRNMCKSCRLNRCLDIGMSRKGIRIGRHPNFLKHRCIKEVEEKMRKQNLENGLKDVNNSGSSIVNSSNPINGVCKSPMHSVLNDSKSENTEEMEIDEEDTNMSINLIVDNNETPDNYSNIESNHKTDIKITKTKPTKRSHKSQTTEKLTANISITNSSNNIHKITNNSDNTNSEYIFNPINIKTELNMKTTNPIIEDPYFNVNNPSLLLNKFEKESPPSFTSENLFENGQSTFKNIEQILFSISESADVLQSRSLKVTPEVNFLKRTDSIHVVWSKMMDHFVYHSQCIVKLAKKLPGFSHLNLSDKKIAIKFAMYPMILVELSQDYRDCGNFIFFNYFGFSVEDRNMILQIFPEFQEFSVHVYESSKYVDQLHFDSVGLSLMCGIIIFYNFKNLEDWKFGEMMFLLYKECLRVYLESIEFSRNNQLKVTSNSSNINNSINNKDDNNNSNSNKCTNLFKSSHLPNNNPDSVFGEAAKKSGNNLGLEYLIERCMKIVETLSQMNMRHHTIISDFCANHTELLYPDLYIEVFKN